MIYLSEPVLVKARGSRELEARSIGMGIGGGRGGGRVVLLFCVLVLVMRFDTPDVLTQNDFRVRVM